MIEGSSQAQAWEPFVIHKGMEGVYYTNYLIIGNRAHCSYGGWVVTDEGVVVVDTGTYMYADKILSLIRKTTDSPIRYIIYTHGHRDHIGGASGLLSENPIIIGHENVVPRLQKYIDLAPFEAKIHSIQFKSPSPSTGRPRVFPANVTPTVTYRDRYEFTLGEVRFELVHAKGETDDHTLVNVPDLRLTFGGDLVEASFPNVGNPYKVQRYVKEWYQALELILSWKPSLVIGADAILEGEEVNKSLSTHIEFLYYLEGSVISKLNEGKSLEQIWEEVQLPEHLVKSPYMKPAYSRLEFAIYNVWKQYCGYFDYNPAHLLPRPSWEVTAVIRELVNDDGKVLSKAKTLMEDGKANLALQVLDVILANEYTNIAARTLRRDVLARLAEEDETLMSRNCWLNYMEEDEKFLASS